MKIVEEKIVSITLEDRIGNTAMIYRGADDFEAEQIRDRAKLVNSIIDCFGISSTAQVHEFQEAMELIEVEAQY